MSTGPLIATASTWGWALVPGLDLEPVDQAAAEVVEHRCVGVRTQVAVAFEAPEEDLETLAEVAGAEIRKTRVRGGLVQQLVGRGIASVSHCRCTRLTRPRPGRDSREPPCRGIRLSSPRDRDR